MIRLFVFIAIGSWITAAPAAELRRVAVELDGGERVSVDCVGQIDDDRVTLLVNRANRSLVSQNPRRRATGSITAGDRIAITDHLLVWIDCTRQDGFWSGGGGMLRGVWMLARDDRGQPNFKYIVNANGWAPNNLYTSPNGKGDAWQILINRVGGTDPEDTFRATSSAAVEVLRDATLDADSQTLTYRLGGIMTAGRGTEDFPWNDNFGDPDAAAQLRYEAVYQIATGTGADHGAGLNCAFQVRVDDDAALHDSPPIKSLVFSLGLGQTNINEKLRLDYLLPIGQSMIRGVWRKNGRGQFVNRHADVTPAGEFRYVPETAGQPEKRYNLSNIFADASTTFESLYLGSDDESARQQLRIRHRASVKSTGFSVFDRGAYFQYLYDFPNENFVVDIKFGDPRQQGPLGVLQKGWSIACYNELIFDDDNLSE